MLRDSEHWIRKGDTFGLNLAPLSWLMRSVMDMTDGPFSNFVISLKKGTFKKHEKSLFAILGLMPMVMMNDRWTALEFSLSL
ncbi:hypothetical protein Bind_0231 [Beijerinckia indica subsp. indica ATCC 9039]|uniref:Uncharacterized protein n=1 Tax=Beijerinckia indica subsp. indica (strain ATCC 9039 / DSM 1715 / NCIMB 8712) TaxID=395963 RepID=B2ICJ8_BEII9|nr:hypothetical protein Bind_0231 [Beijerinckia indica subsp. indica ATCC 9039]